MDTVRGKVLLSENSGSAKSWLPRDTMAPGPFVPRPDCSLTTLRVLSFIPVTNILGINHFYVRSPITGLIKLFTLGGCGLWALWDGIQMLTESDRVLQYGMTGPLDIVTGIGQGMITDKPSSYTSNASYSAWIIGVAFGFLGLDSLMAKNVGQFLRKLLECVLFIVCILGVLNVFKTGITVGWILAIIFAAFFGSIIISEYLAVVTAVFGNDVFSQGIQFTEKQDQQMNGFFSWLIKNTTFSDERKAEIIRDLQYGGLSPEDITKMFSIIHTSEAGRIDKSHKTKSNYSPGSIVSFVLLMCAPFLIIWNFILYVGELIAEWIPWASLLIAAKTARTVALSALKDAAKGKGVLGEGLKTALAGAASTHIPQVSNKTAPISNKAVPQQGGAKTEETLSSEAQIFGAVTMALIGGGAIKGLIDYLMKE